MKCISSFLLALVALVLSPSAHADEGMWLMQQLSSQYDSLKARGLKLSQYDLYNPDGTSLKDAVVRFGAGCTGEIISPQGLVLTNHHCGYGAIQSLSSVEHNYLEDGYWSQSMSQELPVKNLTVTFIDKIEDVTDYVLKALSKERDKNSMNYLSPKYLRELAYKRAGAHFAEQHPGVELELKPFYDGNKYLLFTKKVYRDIRFVGAPPSGIGRFGADSDNWTFPRHSGDFSIFRIYTDANGNPADYAPGNIPLKPKRWFNISTRGVEEGKFAMMMGFPGTTHHFYLPSEVNELKTVDNDICVRVRALRQDVMLRHMQADPKVGIQYASKYALSQNAYKRSIGSNWAIDTKGISAIQQSQAESLLKWARDTKQGSSYASAVAAIDKYIESRHEQRRQLVYLLEACMTGIELSKAPRLSGKGTAEEQLREFDKAYGAFYNGDYSPVVDGDIAKVLLREYCGAIADSVRPEPLRGLSTPGQIDTYVDGMLEHSYLLDKGRYASLRKMAIDEQIKILSSDPVVVYARSVAQTLSKLKKDLSVYDNPISLARRTFVDGLLKQQGADRVWPDANLTLRFTYGQVKGYSPRDAVYYEPQTWLEGVMAKADSTSWEYRIPKRLAELYRTKSYGRDNRWAVRQSDGSYSVPVDFIATTHTTGGNSGSPVFDAEGNLIGINFDRNWEGVGGDIHYLADYQRSIICDIRYILFVVDQLGQCPRLVEEMTLVH